MMSGRRSTESKKLGSLISQAAIALAIVTGPGAVAAQAKTNSDDRELAAQRGLDQEVQKFTEKAHGKAFIYERFASSSAT